MKILKMNLVNFNKYVTYNNPNKLCVELLIKNNIYRLASSRIRMNYYENPFIKFKRKNVQIDSFKSINMHSICS